MSKIRNVMQKLNWLRLALPVAVVVAAMVIVILKAAPNAFVGIFSDPGAFATFFGTILATLGIPYGVWLSSSSESRRKKRGAKAEMANEVLFLVSVMINEVIENLRMHGMSDGQTRLLVDRFNDMSMRLGEALHKANYILDPKDVESNGRLKSLLYKFAECKRAEGYNKTKKEGDPFYIPYSLTLLEYMSILYKNPTDDPFSKELSEARIQMEQVFKKYLE
ncbi:MAG: hypothetical protein ABSG21_15710 [Spirochaetia bacterium]